MILAILLIANGSRWRLYRVAGLSGQAVQRMLYLK